MLYSPRSLDSAMGTFESVLVTVYTSSQRACSAGAKCVHTNTNAPMLGSSHSKRIICDHVVVSNASTTTPRALILHVEHTCCTHLFKNHIASFSATCEANVNYMPVHPLSAHSQPSLYRCSRDKHLALRMRALRVNIDQSLDGQAARGAVDASGPRK